MSMSPPFPPATVAALPTHGTSGAAPTWWAERHTTDIDEHAIAQPEWRLHYEQLSRGGFAGYVQHVQLPGLRAVLETMNCAARQRGEIGANDVGFSMSLKLDTEAFFHGQRVDQESIMIGRGDDLDLTSPQDYEHIAVVVEEGLLSELWERFYQKPWSSWLNEQVVVKARPGAADGLRAAHLSAISSIALNPGMLQDATAALQLRDTLLMEWIEAVPIRVETGDLKTSAARKALVDRVCAIVAERVDQPPTVLEICKQIGSSPRRLEYCFADVLGMSPSKYLRAVRLNGVRRELKRQAHGPESIHDIAARWGFWHMGAFSSDYKRQFGELPSATVQAARLTLTMRSPVRSPRFAIR